MKSTKIVSLLLAGALATGALAGCSQPSDNSAAEQTGGASQEQVVQGGTAQQAEQQSAEQEAQQLLSDLSGSYQELFPVIFDERYDQLWVDDSAAIVGEADAAESAEALKDSVNGTIWGKEAIDAYGDEGGPFFCGWLEGLAELTIDGDAMEISGKDASGQELFSGTYHYSGMAADFYVFESDDDEAGSFKYFAFLPDTPESTFHIEFRYGADDADFGEWMAGDYAYWMASGFPTNPDQQMIEDVIKLFCDENLAQE